MNYIKIILFLIPVFSFSQRHGLQLTPVDIVNFETSFITIKQKTDSLEQGLISKVSILHIGDSHIQPDDFSGFVTQKMQAKYGNGGRGLVFSNKNPLKA